VHNGGTAPLTDVRLVRLTYADSARGAAWLVATSRQSSVAPDELATIGTLRVNWQVPEAGTYRFVLSGKRGLSDRVVTIGAFDLEARD